MDLDTLLQHAGTVPDDPAALATGRAALDEATARVVARSAAGARALKRRRHRQLSLAGLVAAAAAAVVAVPAVGLHGGPAARADAAQVLLRAGQAAGAQSGDWKQASYWRSVSRYQQGDSPVRTREIWIGHTHPGVLKDGGVEDGYIPLEVALFPAGGSGITWDGLWQLPTDATELNARLRAGIHGAGPDDDSEMFVIVGDLLRESPAPPALRKALWEVAATIPDVKLVGPVTDGAGRPGTAVERHGQRYVLDADDGRLLEESALGWRSTYLEQGPTETAPQATYVAPKKG